MSSLTSSINSEYMKYIEYIKDVIDQLDEISQLQREKRRYNNHEGVSLLSFSWVVLLFWNGNHQVLKKRRIWAEKQNHGL